MGFENNKIAEENNKIEKYIKIMDKVIFEHITDEDIVLIKKWLQKDYIKKWYDPINDWIYEIENRSGEFNFIKHFIVKNGSEKIGFCQYYDCFLAQEDWYKINEKGITYSIDYLIGERNYLNKGFGKEIVKGLVEKIKMENAMEIIVKPELENIQSGKVLIANGFIYDNNRKYYYKKL
ncbi:MAG: GNAT family N-acetyltransferase [Helicobacteraceae bacterium]|nr:GNAT family N-acetyltransferase [Helicobacteraceae bacterium]